ncbi:MAG: hypothetical protein GXP47_15275 [Acidobacteria bacterium]|nr:hypothetical protein [Acidobacteriota bacterium]
MNDRVLIRRLLEIGISVYQKTPDGYATQTDDPKLRNIGAATIANWLEELGRYRLIGDVQPCCSE